MRKIDLKVSFGLSEFNRFNKRNKMQGFAAFSDKVMRRDDYSCRFCGFKAKQHMSILNADHNYRNNKAGNMYTACPLCTQCHFIEHIGVMPSSGAVLIYLPEMSQADLNGLVHSLFCSIANSTVHEQSAQNSYNALKLRSKIVEKAYGEGRSDPRIFSNMIINTVTDDTKALHGELLKDLRVLAKINSFTQQIQDWSSSAVAAMETDISVKDN